MTPDACWSHLLTSTHGVLATGHPVRGPDPVPVVFALHENQILIPVDTVKPKRHTRLQRLVNLEADPRCALLVDHYEEDWSALWWVRVSGPATVRPPDADLLGPLADRFPAYRAPGAVASVIVLTPATVTGWSAQG
jgi:PPOX class probable F420-dependent enzyme